MDDEKIIGLFWNRDEQALAETQTQYGKLCMATAKRILTDVRDAEECVSDACMKAWKTIPPKRPESLAAYLVRITRNLALDRYDYNRAGKRSSALESSYDELEQFLGFDDSIESALEKRNFERVLNDFLYQQSKEARIYFVRRYWYGESIREVAQACDVGEAKVKVSIFRTRQRLKEVLKREGILA